ncbi:gamma-butyrobetaine hydroxylase-like domain-containing protein [Methyloprofundus sp.]|uniref:gamma-butyrobetaine hydroxylase-like domain-containing protein n=1 Tax=Methyloprofundus sp. TaxID=2020875 RepID=UPI003D0DAEDC
MRIKAEEIDTHPTEIKLHKVSRILEVSFADGKTFHLPCEYLRVFTPSAEALGHAPGQEILQTGKEAVSIEDIRPIGNYGISPDFSDGHSTGIYTWELLYKLGNEYDVIWTDYLEELKAAGHSRVEIAKN